jgi:hypothetical protein
MLLQLIKLLRENAVTEKDFLAATTATTTSAPAPLVRSSLIRCMHSRYESKSINPSVAWWKKRFSRRNNSFDIKIQKVLKIIMMFLL